ncbi:MAG: hypothetical protein JRJ49_11090 [Deltaproteobacteria bacterium]|nr:hypothetical protein [Deltaproteobacteria bacterium]
MAFENKIKIDSYTYEKGESFEVNLADNYKNKIDNHIEKFNDLVNQDFSFETMEIFGTALYCYLALKEIDITPNYKNVLEEFEAWKGDKYKQKETDIKNIWEKINQIYSQAA